MPSPSSGQASSNEHRESDITPSPSSRALLGDMLGHIIGDSSWSTGSSRLPPVASALLRVPFEARSTSALDISPSIAIASTIGTDTASIIGGAGTK